MPGGQPGLPGPQTGGWPAFANRQAIAAKGHGLPDRELHRKLAGKVLVEIGKQEGWVWEAGSQVFWGCRGGTLT